MYNNKSKVKRIAIIGAGASGCICAYWLLKNGCDVTLFDKASPLRTLLPTGGGRCNLAHAEFDSRELAKNYPRGEKFLYSIFSKFSTYDTLSMFEELGVETYTQEDNRIFPKSDSAKEVRIAILDKINSVVREEVIKLDKSGTGFKIKTDKSEYFFTDVVIAIGGHSGYDFLKSTGVRIVEPKPSLVGLNTQENLKDLSGTAVKNVCCGGFVGDVLFTHFGISGPLVYKISSVKAFDILPYRLVFNLYPQSFDFQSILNNNPHKEIKNVLKDFLPQKVVKFILKDIPEELKSHKVDGKTRDLILDRIHGFEVNITGTNKGEETVTAGGVDLDEINPKTMEFKRIPHLYCVGEVLNIDGFCGGFNLQNAWSTAYVAALGILSDK